MGALERLKAVKGEDELRSAVLKKYAQVDLPTTKIYVFGAASLGRRIAGYAIAQGLDVEAFVDNDVNKQGTLIDGLKVVSPGSITDKDSTIVVASGFMADIGEQLQNDGFHQVIPFPVLSILDPAGFPCELSKGMLSDLVANSDRYAALYDMLADNKSRDTLDRLLEFRLTMNPSALAGLGEPPQNEYLDSVLKMTDEEVLVDGGAFNGDTAQAFIDSRRGKYKKMMLFEPDMNLLAEARARLKKYENINYYGYGLYSKRETLRFSAPGDHSGSINGHGDIEINVVALDEFIQEKITFLKLDIEGAEIDALRGASGHIVNDRMKLAVCVYHRPSDVWRIPALLKEINPELKLYLRQYSRAVFETVLYAVPSL